VRQIAPVSACLVCPQMLTHFAPACTRELLLRSECCMHLISGITSRADRWSRPKPPREQRICRHCSMQAVEDEQHFLFDCPFYNIIRGQHFSLFGPNYQQRDLRLIFQQNSHQLGFVAHHIHLCFQARMSDKSQLAPHPRL
jgi:hypothetical protein